MTRGPFPLAQIYQARLANGWVLTDASGVVNTITDGSGYTDILTTATAGTFYLTKALDQTFRGDAADGGAVALQAVSTLARILSGSVGDQLVLGAGDNSDPSAGLWEGAGLEYVTSTTFGLVKGDETLPAAGTTLTIDRAFGPQQFVCGGASDYQQYVYGLQGNSLVGFRGKSSGSNRALAPTHLVVMVKQATAVVQTIRIAAGFQVAVPIPSLDIVPRI